MPASFVVIPIPAALRGLPPAAMPLVLVLRQGGDKGLRQLSLAPVLDVEVSDDAEGHGADEVDEQILHGIVQPDIQIPVKAQIRAVDGHRVDAVDGDGGVAVGGVQHHGGNALHHGVLLHIQMEHPVHAELEKLPQHPHGHGEAEGRQRHIYRRQLELDAAVAVQDVDKGKAVAAQRKPVVVWSMESQLG